MSMTEDPKVELKVFQGSKLASHMQKMVELGMIVFREYPYLYEGTLSIGMSAHKPYLLAEDSLLVVAEVGNQFIGAIIGLPVAESMEEIKQIFLDHQILMDGVYYLGEIILLKEYRSKGIGHAMLQMFENAVGDLGEYRKIIFCEVDRSNSDIKRPSDYKPLNPFWEKRGYIKDQNLVTNFAWPEIGDQEKTNHPMVFWSKDIAY